MQKILKPEQITSFYHDEAVNQQVLHFRKLVLIDNIDAGKVVVDIGGGVRLFRTRIVRRVGAPGACDRH